MHDLRHKPTLVAVAILLIAAPPLVGDESGDLEQAKRVACLIDSLASKNQAPIISGDARSGEDQTIRFPADYDRCLQVPVYLAVKELLAEDEVAMDLLLAHEDDDRYSFSVNAQVDRNVTVSEVCEWIARQKLLAYEPELHVITGTQFQLFNPGERVSLKAWWAQNRQRGLVALQIEAIDAAIEFMADVDSATALPWHPLAARLPPEEFNRRREANLQMLKAIRQYVVATGKPYRAKTLDDAHSRFFGLPWTGRRYNK